MSSFRIEPGDVYGYLGPNGSGKTTDVRMLTGLLEPTAGGIFFKGRDIRRDLISYRRLLGFVPEEPHLYPYLSGKEYLELVGRLRSLPRASDRNQSGESAGALPALVRTAMPRFPHIPKG